MPTRTLGIQHRTRSTGLTYVLPDSHNHRPNTMQHVLPVQPHTCFNGVDLPLLGPAALLEQPLPQDDTCSNFDLYLYMSYRPLTRFSEFGGLVSSLLSGPFDSLQFHYSFESCVDHLTVFTCYTRLASQIDFCPLWPLLPLTVFTSLSSSVFTCYIRLAHIPLSSCLYFHH